MPDAESARSVAAAAGSEAEAIRLSDITAAILAGGLGTRLRPVVPDRPKPLAEIAGRPFLAALLDQLEVAGLRRVVLCTGYLAEHIRATFGERYGGLRLSYSQEAHPLGTAGALRLALAHLESDPILVMNGDSFCAVDITKFLRWHLNRRAAATLVLTRVHDAERYGSVEVNERGAVIQFAEKQAGATDRWINAGIYLLTRRVVESIPPHEKLSLESEIFPKWIGNGLYGWQQESGFIDIGTPEDFHRAGSFFRAAGKKFIVLDRDGTVIEECNYLSDPEHVRLLPGVGPALRALKNIGYGLVIITNQSGIGRGFFDRTRLEEIHERMKQLLAAEDVVLDGIYFCPHTPAHGCQCRKPAPGLLQQAASELGFEPSLSIVIGDKATDIEMGRRAGATTFLVRTGYGSHEEADGVAVADYVVDDVGAAVEVIQRLTPREGSETHGH